MRTYKYDIVVITDKGSVPCCHISPYCFPVKDFIEIFEDAHPGMKAKEVRVISREGVGKSKLAEWLNRQKTKKTFSQILMAQ